MTHEDKIKHLEMIQDIIKRMASNCFMMKGWAVTLVAGLFALAGKETDQLYCLIAYLPIIVFWGLDTYYLLTERLYRALYDEVRNKDDAKIDYSLKATKDDYGDEDKNNYCSCFFSGTEFGFYFPLAIVSTGIVILSKAINS